MRNLWILRVLGVIVLLIGIVAVGVVAYNAGVSQAQTAVPAAQMIAPWRGGMEWHPLAGLFFLPFLFCLVPLFLGLFIFLPLRMIFGPHRMHMHMHGHWNGEEGSVPPPVEEWHRRMHEKSDKPS
jgi:hypothetical protein